MSVQTTITDGVPAATDEEYRLNGIGIEFEFPIVGTQDHGGLEPPAIDGQESSGLAQAGRDKFGSEDWLPGLFGNEGGYPGTDHTGAEITSGVLDLHTPDPNDWYRATIEEAKRLGYEFAATGQGYTNFGLHQHVSNIDPDTVWKINDMAHNEWARVFFCASISETSLDPWRHGGVTFMSPGEDRFGSPPMFGRGPRSSEYHWEFRLPEPVLPQHFDKMVTFWRLIAREGFEAARDYAYEVVHSEEKEELTPVIQARMYDEAIDSWPPDGAYGEALFTDQAAAEWFADYMGY